MINKTNASISYKYKPHAYYIVNIVWCRGSCRLEKLVIACPPVDMEIHGFFGMRLITGAGHYCRLRAPTIGVLSECEHLQDLGDT